MTRNSKTWIILEAVVIFCLASLSQAQATVTPYLVTPTGFSSYTILSDLSNGGNFNLNQSIVDGNLGVINSSLNNSNNDTINGNLSYTQSQFSKNSTVAVTGKSSLDVTLATASTQAALFSKTIANFTVASNHVINGDNAGSSISLAAYAAVNVFQLTNNINGTITLTGNSSEVFYINVTGAFNISGVVLNGVDAKNVYWNIISGSNVNLSGSLSGTFLAYNSNTSQATSLNINNATIEGNIYGGSMNISNSTINGVSLGEALEAPEANSVFALSIFAALLFGSSLKRCWNRRRQVQVAAAA